METSMSHAFCYLIVFYFFSYLNDVHLKLSKLYIIGRLIKCKMIKNEV